MRQNIISSYKIQKDRIDIIQTNKHDNSTSPLDKNEEFTSQFNINPYEI
jgi:hypothetical protein